MITKKILIIASYTTIFGGYVFGAQFGGQIHAILKEESMERHTKTVMEELNNLDFSSYQEYVDDAVYLIDRVSNGQKTENIGKFQKCFLANIANLIHYNKKLKHELDILSAETNIDSSYYFDSVYDLTKTLSAHEYGILFDEKHLKDFYFTLTTSDVLERIENKPNTTDSAKQIARQLQGVIIYAESLNLDKKLLRYFELIYEKFKYFDTER